MWNPRGRGSPTATRGSPRGGRGGSGTGGADEVRSYGGPSTAIHAKALACVVCFEAHDRSPFVGAACVPKHGPGERICRTCVVQLCKKAFDEAEHTGRFPEVRCPVDGCLEIWTYDDWIASGFFLGEERRTRLSVQYALSVMPEVRFCPLCKAAGWLGTEGCADCICSDPRCNFVFCSRCQQNTHNGACGAPENTPELSLQPDRIFNLDERLGSSLSLKSMQMWYPPAAKRKTLLDNDRGLVYQVENLLTEDECRSILKIAETEGFDSLEKLFPRDYRSNDRLLARSVGLADHIYKRLAKLFTPSDLRRTPMGPTGEGMWLPCAINEMHKISRYRATCLFKPHRDGPYVPDIDYMSALTVIIYLNGPKGSQPMKGGFTRFLYENDLTRSLLEVTPSAGRAVVFSQDLVHDGAAVLTGTKFILRTELMYRRVHSVLDRSPAYLAASDDLRRLTEAYRRSSEAIAKGDQDTYMSEYFKALEIQAKPHPVSQKLPIPDDIVLEIFLYLSDACLLLTMGRVNRGLYRLARDNSMWRTRMHRTFPTAAATGEQDLTVNWLKRYRTEIERRREADPNKETCATIDFGSAYLRCNYPGRAIACPCFYRIEIDSYTHHGTRYKVDKMVATTPEETEKILSRDAWPKGVVCALNMNGTLAPRGAQFFKQQCLHHSITNSTVVVPDDWTPVLINSLQDAVPANITPRFVCTSVAVLARFDLRSGVVVSLGRQNLFMSVVLNQQVLRTRRILNFQPNKDCATKICAAVHSMLLDGAVQHADAEEVRQAAERVLAAAAADKNVTPKFVAEAEKAMQKFAQVDPNKADSARETVGWNAVFTGGKAGRDKFDELVRNELNALSPKWRVHISLRPSEDAVVGAATLPRRSEALWYNCTALPPPSLPPLV